MSEWGTREARELVSLYAQSGRISRAQRLALEKRIGEGEVNGVLADLLRTDGH